MARIDPLTSPEIAQLKREGLLGQLANDDDAARQKAINRFIAMLAQGNRDKGFFDQMGREIAIAGAYQYKKEHDIQAFFFGGKIDDESLQAGQSAAEMFKKANSFIFDSALVSNPDGGFSLGEPIKPGKSTTGPIAPFSADNFFKWGTPGILDRINDPEKKKRDYYRGELVTFANMNAAQKEAFAKKVYELGAKKMEAEIKAVWDDISKDPDVKADGALQAQIRYLAEKARWDQGGASVGQIMARMDMVPAALFHQKFGIGEDGNVNLSGKFPRYEAAVKAVAEEDEKSKPAPPSAYPKPEVAATAPAVPPATPTSAKAYTPEELGAMSRDQLMGAISSTNDATRQEAVYRLTMALADREANKTEFDKRMAEGGLKNWNKTSWSSYVIPDVVARWWGKSQVEDGTKTLDEAARKIFDSEIKRDPNGRFVMGDPLPANRPDTTGPVQPLTPGNLVKNGIQPVLDQMNSGNRDKRIASRKQLFALGNMSEAEMDAFAKEAHRLGIERMLGQVNTTWASLSKDGTSAKDAELKAQTLKVGDITRVDMGAGSPEQIKAYLKDIAASLYDKKVEEQPDGSAKVVGDMPRGEAAHKAREHANRAAMAAAVEQGNNRLALAASNPPAILDTPMPTLLAQQTPAPSAQVAAATATGASPAGQGASASASTAAGVAELQQELRQLQAKQRAGVAGRSVEDLIDEGIVQKRKEGKMFETPPDGMTARKPYALGGLSNQGGTIASRTIDNWAAKGTGTVIIGGQKYDMAKPRDVADLRQFATGNYNGFLDGRLVDTAQLAAATAAEKRAAELKTKITQLERAAAAAPKQQVAAAGNPATQPAPAAAPKPGAPPPGPAPAPATKAPDMPTAKAAASVAATAPAESAPAPAPKPAPRQRLASADGLPTATAADPQPTVEQHAGTAIKNRRKLSEMSQAYLTGMNMTPDSHKQEMKALFQRSIASITGMDIKIDGRIGPETAKAMRAYVALEKNRHKRDPNSAPDRPVEVASIP